MTKKELPHPACLEPAALLKQCEVTRTRRSGPGGQNRNKVETAVVLSHRPTGVIAEGSERRSQKENLASALFRLRVKLALEVRTPSAEVSVGEPSTLWRSRCRGGILSINPEHSDFPAMLSEAMDQVAAADADVRLAAERLGSSSSQLTRFLKLEPRALRIVNDMRQALGRHPLR